MIRILLIALALHSLAVSAHELSAEIGSARITMVTLRYADGEPFSYEQFEVVEEGGTVPLQIGRTDARGRAAILPVNGKLLTFRATSKDGHGKTLAIPAIAETHSAPAAAPEVPRWLLVLAGGGVLFGLFGLAQLFARRR